MERTDDLKVTRYKDGEFWIDIVELESKYEAWIHHDAYGISRLMFGVPKSWRRSLMIGSMSEFIELVERNLQRYEEHYLSLLKGEQK